MEPGPPGTHNSDELLDALARGALPPGQSETVRQHLTKCPDCAARFTDIRNLIASLRAAADQLNKVPLRYLHQTESGEVYLKAYRARGAWVAEVNSVVMADRLATCADANTELLRVFDLMYPTHECTDACGFHGAELEAELGS
jgi:hypothetical protein